MVWREIKIIAVFRRARKVYIFAPLHVQGAELTMGQASSWPLEASQPIERIAALR